MDVTITVLSLPIIGDENLIEAPRFIEQYITFEFVILKKIPLIFAT